MLSNRDEINKFYKGPLTEVSCKVWFHLAKRFQRRRFLKTLPIIIKNCPWRLCFFSDQNGKNKLSKGPPIDTSCRVWFHLAKRFQRRRFFKNQVIRIKNCPWGPCFFPDRNGKNKLYIGPLIDDCCKVWFHLVKRF